MQTRDPVLTENQASSIEASKIAYKQPLVTKLLSIEKHTQGGPFLPSVEGTITGGS